eukprot:GFKZ01011800.1.p1 GENE.GFKZ01011800.1~~GFKZ01011800.1.p1  ORF type:complete len:331 (-),score=17.39 GFKZ01011800.1:214-1206(-)
MKPVFYFAVFILFGVVWSKESPIDDENFILPEGKSFVRTISANMDISAVERQRRVRPCGGFCRFRLCNFNGNTFVRPKADFVILNGPNAASLPYVCLPGFNIGQIRSSLEARVTFRGSLVPISRFSPPGLGIRYPSNFIKTAAVPFLPWTGISRRQAQGNQWDFLHDRCMILPIRRYQEINATTQLPIRVVSAGGSNRNCVAFRTTAPAIQVELTWDSGDDFDLAVEEPDGDVISFRNRRSEAGRLTGDNNVGFCDSELTFGRENVVYFPGGPIEEGQYRVIVTHFNRCDTSPTVWRVRIIINGNLVLSRRGTASRGRQQVVLNAPFQYP